MQNFKTAVIHTPKLYKENDKFFSLINFCASGLFSMAGELHKSGFPVKIIHLGIEKYLDKSFKLSNYVKQNNIKFIAFSLQWHSQSYDVIETARNVKKENPNIYISLGGYSASYFADEILETYPFIDFIIKGEGEKPITEIALALKENKNLENIPNLYWRKNGKIIQNKEIFIAENDDLNSFEFFNSDRMLNYDVYVKAGYILDYSKNSLDKNLFDNHCISLGRGCLGNCVWCGGGFNAQKIVTGRNKISYRNPESIIKEIKQLKSEHNIKVFTFSFDPNPTNRMPIIDVLNLIAFEFKGEITANYNMDGLPDKLFLDAFKKAFSPNSTLLLSPIFENEQLRKKYKSFYYTNNQLEETLNYMEQLNIKSEIYFSAMPGVLDIENEKSKKYGDYLKSKYKLIKEYYIFPIDIEPASPWTFTPEKYGLTDIKTTFKDYYDANKGLENSFEINF